MGACITADAKVGRHGRGQLRDRLRGQDARLPGAGEGHRRARRAARRRATLRRARGPALHEAALRHGRPARAGEDRGDQGEHRGPPLRALPALGRAASSPPTSTRRPPRSACSWSSSAGTADAATLQAYAKDVAMHVAAASPAAALYVAKGEVPADVLEKEKEIYRAQAAASGKPANVVDKIAEGKVKEYYGTFCLLEQPFIKDPKLTVGQMLKHGVEVTALRPLPPGRGVRQGRRGVVVRLARPASRRGPGEAARRDTMPGTKKGLAYKRILLKLSGEALLGEKPFGIDRNFTDYLAQEILRGPRAGPRDRRGRRRRQHLPRRLRQRPGHGPRHRGPHGDARDRDQRAGAAGRARARRRLHARALGDRDAGGLRALHPPARDAPHGEGPRHGLRRRHRATRTSRPTPPRRCARWR